MTKKKILLATILPLLAVVVIGATMVSAQGGSGMGHGPGGYGFIEATPEEVVTRHTAMFEQQANILGISVDAVKQAWAEGQSFSDLASANGISEDDLQNKMKELAKTKIKEHLQTLVSQGVITQAQADQRLQIESSMIDSGMGKGFGKGGHRGGPGGPGGM
jgi:hypothetical protein